MTEYESLLEIAKVMGLNVIEKADIRANGRINSNNIFLSNNLDTTPEKVCTLYEEINHAIYNIGDITDQSNSYNRKQEYRARKNCYEELTPLIDIIDAVMYLRYESTPYNVAQYLGVTEKFLNEAIEYYKRRNGPILYIGIYRVEFYPSFKVNEKHK